MPDLLKKLFNDKPYLSLSNDKYRLRQYFVIYTAMFSAVCCIVFCWYFFEGRTFIWQGDGWIQHYKALVYYAEYLRSLINELFYNHRFVFPEWDFAFGEGNDILQSLHYYVIGDPFSVFSVFVSTRFLWIYYDFMILLRVYLSGIAFSCLCFYTQKNTGRYAVMAGSLAYVFCYWTIYNVNRHPYFLNPMLYYPLIILGIEKILRKEKPYLFVIAVFLAAISNFYFFFSIVLLTVGYAVIRLITKYKTDIKSMLNALMRIAGGAILGVLMGGIILAPVIFDFLNDSRLSSGNAWHFIYPLSYYSGLLKTFFSGYGDYWLCMGFAAPVILAVFLLFMRKKKHGFLKICFLVCTAVIFIPALGQLLNGMSYMSNRWSWAFALLCAYIFTVMWPELMALKSKDAVKLAFALSICFFALMLLEYSRKIVAFACIGTAFIFLFVIFPFQTENQKEGTQRQKYKQAVALALVIIGVANVSFFVNSPSASNYAKEAKEADDVAEQLMLTEVKAVQDAAASDGTTDFYRYSGRNTTYNTGTLYHISGTSYYWSLSNPATGSFRRTMELIEPLEQEYRGYDDRTALITLSSVKYYVVPESDNAPVPYGFTYVDTFNVKESVTEEALEQLQGEFENEELSEAQIKVIESATESKYKVYRNDNALPLAYVYDNIISEDKWNTLSAAEKQEAMLQGVVLAGYNGNTQDNAVLHTGRSLDYTVKCNGTGVTLEDYGFAVTSANATATVSFEGINNSETYFVIHGLNVDRVSTYELYFGDKKYDPLNLFNETRWNLLTEADRDSIKKSHRYWTEPTGTNLTVKSSAGVSKTINYYTEDYSWYSDRHDFTVCLDYSENAVTSVTLTFPSVGIYSFDSIEIVCQPMVSYKEQVAALKNTPVNITVGTDTIWANVDLKKPQVLYFSVPYSVGWTAFVDGEEAPLYQANIKNMALVLPAGEHSVKLSYHTPLLRIGAAASALGLMGFAALLFINIVKKKRAK